MNETKIGERIVVGSFGEDFCDEVAILNVNTKRILAIRGNGEGTLSKKCIKRLFMRCKYAGIYKLLGDLRGGTAVRVSESTLGLLPVSMPICLDEECEAASFCELSALYELPENFSGDVSENDMTERILECAAYAGAGICIDPPHSGKMRLSATDFQNLVTYILALSLLFRKYALMRGFNISTCVIYRQTVFSVTAKLADKRIPALNALSEISALRGMLFDISAIRDGDGLNIAIRFTVASERDRAGKCRADYVRITPEDLPPIELDGVF